MFVIDVIKIFIYAILFVPSQLNVLECVEFSMIFGQIPRIWEVL